MNLGGGMSTLSVMILEDHPLRRAVIAGQLKLCGITQIIEVEKAERALSLLLERGGVDIAICDLSMFGMGSLDFLHILSRKALVKAVMICSEVDIMLRDAIGSMIHMWGINFLGDLGKPTSLARLNNLVTSYQHDSAQYHRVKSDNQTEVPIIKEEIEEGLYRHEFVAYFQPKVNLPDGNLLGAEVLARWVHPTRGVLGPGAFLPQLEDDGAIDALFWQLIEQGLGIQKAHPGLMLAFNIHPAQLSRPGFSDRLQQKLEAYSVPASLLTLEITETGKLSVTSDTLAVLVRLRLMGCVLSMDDFGAGFSSIGRLCELPFNQIKLDGNFVKGMYKGSKGYEVIHSVVGLANALNISLVIEGVETSEQRDYLMELGVQEAQGFHFGRPQPEAEFIQAIATYQACT